MKKQQEKSLALGVFLGYISLAEALKINSKLPDYWSDWHRDTWRYTDHPRYVDQDQWVGDQPKGYDAVQLPNYWSDWHRDTWRYTDHPRLANETEWKEGAPKGYDDTTHLQSGAEIKQKHRHHHKKSAKAKDWTENHLRHMGKFDDYKEDAPAGYAEHVVWEAPEEETPDEKKERLAKEIYTKGVADAKEAVHKHPKWNVQISKQQLAQAKARSPEDGKSWVDKDIDSLTWAWTDDQHDKSNEETWHEETQKITGGAYNTFAQKRHGKKLRKRDDEDPDAKCGSNCAWTDNQALHMNQTSYEEETKKPSIPYKKLVHAQQLAQEHPYRKNAWNDVQNSNSNEATWQAETENPTGYQHWLEENKATQKRGQKLMQTRSRGSKWGYDPDRLTAWNDEQADMMNPGTWQAETDKPTGYQKWLEENKDTFKVGQKMVQKSDATYPSKDSHSEVLPYFQREHAWNKDQHDQSNEKTWDHETKNPSGYQVLPGFVQKNTYPSKDSHSEVTPYSQREHSWNEDEFDMSNEKQWDHETKKPSGYQVLPGFVQKATYPSKDSHSEVTPYSQREHSWNEDEFDMSNEKQWDHETKKPSGYQVLPGFAQKATYPSKDSHSEVTPYFQREHAWNEDQFDMSSEKKWDHETKNPSGYQVLPGFAQKATYPSKDSHSEVTPYFQREHAWNEDQFDMSSEKKWDHETKNPSGYQVLPGFAQTTPSYIQKDAAIRTYPSKDSHSEVLPYFQREHAWNNDQHDQSNAKTWDHETKNPSGYQVQPGFAQVDQRPQQMADAKKREDYRVETHSKVIPYVVRDHAWNFDEHDATDFARYRQDTPDGYKEHLTYIKPHPTNVPYMVPPECDAQDQQVNAAKLTEAAEKAYTEGKTDMVKVSLKITGKIYSSCHTKVKPAPPPPPPTEDDEDCVGGKDVKTGAACLPGEETKAAKAAAAAAAAAKPAAASAAKSGAKPAAAKTTAVNTTKNATVNASKNATKNATQAPVAGKKVEAKVNATSNATAKANVTAKANATTKVNASAKVNTTANVTANVTKNVSVNASKNVTQNATLNATKAIAVNVTKVSALNSSKNSSKSAIKEAVKALQVNSTRSVESNKTANGTKILQIKKPSPKSPPRVALKSNATSSQQKV